MCAEVTREVRKVTNKFVWAWKAIDDDKSNRVLWTPVFRSGLFKRGAWVTALHPFYGFNCYTSRRAADLHEEKTVRVRVRQVYGYGKWGKHRVIFAREIFVPKGRKKNGH